MLGQLEKQPCWSKGHECKICGRWGCSLLLSYLPPYWLSQVLLWAKSEEQSKQGWLWTSGFIHSINTGKPRCTGWAFSYYKWDWRRQKAICSSVSTLTLISSFILPDDAGSCITTLIWAVQIRPSGSPVRLPGAWCVCSLTLLLGRCGRPHREEQDVGASSASWQEP